MGRKNRKGRSAGERPRRQHAPKRRRDRRPHDAWSDGPDGGREAAEPAGRRQALAPEPARGLWFMPDDLNVAPPIVAGSGPATADAATAVQTCGQCREWSSLRGDLAGDRGECLHPGSGVSFPPAGMEACPFFS